MSELGVLDLNDNITRKGIPCQEKASVQVAWTTGAVAPDTMSGRESAARREAAGQAPHTGQDARRDRCCTPVDVVADVLPHRRTPAIPIHGRTCTTTPSSAHWYNRAALSVPIRMQPYVTGRPRLLVHKIWEPLRVGKPWKPFIKSKVGTGR